MDPSVSLPDNCHVGGYEESENYQGPLYIGRKMIEEELVIGKVIDKWKSGYCKYRVSQRSLQIAEFNFSP